MLGRYWGVSATSNTSMLSRGEESQGEKKTWKISLQRKRGSLDELEEGKARGRRDCASIHLASPVSYSLFWMRLIFSPLGSINGWPHLFDWKYTSSWFWNIGKYALSSPPSQEVAQCLRPLPLERQKTGSRDVGTGSCAQGSACCHSTSLRAISVTFSRGGHPTHKAEPHTNCKNIFVVYLWNPLLLGSQSTSSN